MNTVLRRIEEKCEAAKKEIDAGEARPKVKRLKRVLKNPCAGVTFFGFVGDCKGKSGIPHHKDPA